MATITKEIRLGTNRGKPRLWLEGQWLHDAGFTRGTKFVAIHTPGSLTLRVTREPAPSLPIRTVSGKDRPDGTPHPIIDINGQVLAPLAGRPLTLIVMKTGVIRIVPAS